MKRYYFDHAATTPLAEEVLAAMLPFFCEKYANPSSSHALGRNVVASVDEARDALAALFGRKAKELYFTSGGTESDNWAIKGVMHANRDKGRHLLVSAFEHPAVLETAAFLSREGYEVEYIPATPQGFVDLDALASMVRDDTVLVCVMAANNEVGTLQPLREAAEIAHKKGALFFTDAVQAVGSVAIPKEADLFSCSAHKFYGPKGIGLLCVREGVRIERLLHGGHQERSMRGGTTPSPLVIGLWKAASLAIDGAEEETSRVRTLRDRFLRGVLSLPNTALNGDSERRLASNANVCFYGRRGEILLDNLDMRGICASTGSACTSGAVHPSHVLLAMGKKEEAESSIRFSFGRDNTEKEIDEALEIIASVVKKK